MLNSISTFSHQIFSTVREKINIALSEKEKKVTLVATLALGFLAVAFSLACRCFKKSKVSNVNANSKQVYPTTLSSKNFASSGSHIQLSDPGMTVVKAEGLTSYPQKDPATYTPFEKAMDLMFEDRGLQWGVWITSMTPEKKQERFEELKKNIDLILEDEVNNAIIYRDGMIDRSQTLLLQAIMCITNPAHRLEIVDLLIKKGANPYVDGFCYAPIYVKDEALKTKDEQLINLIDVALKRHKLSQLVSKGIAVRV